MFRNSEWSHASNAWNICKTHQKKKHFVCFAILLNISFRTLCLTVRNPILARLLTSFCNHTFAINWMDDWIFVWTVQSLPKTETNRNSTPGKQGTKKRHYHMIIELFCVVCITLQQYIRFPSTTVMHFIQKFRIQWIENNHHMFQTTIIRKFDFFAWYQTDVAILSNE